MNKDDNFFNLGGNSLSGLMLIEQVNKACDASLTIRDLFTSPTVNGLANRIDTYVKNQHHAYQGVMASSEKANAPSNFVSWYCQMVNQPYIHGEQNIPKQGPVIVAINHHHALRRTLAWPHLLRLIQHLDQKPCLLSARWLRFCRVMMDFVFTPMFVSKQNTQEDLETIDALVTHLKHGKVLIMSPEGTVNNGKLITGKIGAAYLATRANAKILPVAITKPMAASNINLFRTEIKIGSPLDTPDGQASYRELEGLTSQVMHSIAKLLPEHERGYYANSDDW